MSTEARYVARAVPGGWRIFNRRTKRWWGNYFREYPEDVLAELNGQRRPDVLTQLCRKSYGGIV